MRKFALPIVLGMVLAVPAFASVVLPPISNNFCSSVEDAQKAIGALSTDAAAGVTWSSSIFAPAAGGGVCVFIQNLGPGAIVYQPPSWSVNGNALHSGVIPMTPKGSSANFNDNGWAGTFAEGSTLLGHVSFSDVQVSKGKQGNAHLDLKFFRPATGQTYTVRVNVHFSDLGGANR